MADEHKLQQSDKPTERDASEDERKQPSADHNDAASFDSSAPADSSPAAILEKLLEEKDVTAAEAAKAEGNAHFSNRNYDAAIESYTHAIMLCPTPIPTPSTANSAAPSSHATPPSDASSPSSDPSSASPSSAALTTLLSTLYSNRAAAHLNLNHYAPTIADAAQSIALQPSVKALLRRSIAYEREEKYAEAIEDVKAAIARGGLDGKGSGVREEEERLRRLEARRKEKEEAMKSEMLGKLKDLGNGLLGKFGMSLDNFKAVKDPNTGSYSISFGK